MKNITKHIYIILFLVICILPMGLYILSLPASVTNKKSKDDKQVNIEKTQKATFPKFIDGGKLNEHFDDECEAWLNQNIPFRGQLLTKINGILGEGLKEPTANVVPGKDGWIYSVETTDNYMDANAMSDEQRKATVVTLSLIQEKVEASGGKFLFVPVPNKNSIYPEYMPKRYHQAADNNLTRLYDELEAGGVEHINLKQDLLAGKEKQKERLYFKRDTHWTTPGAVIGYESMVKKFGKESSIEGTVKYSVSKTRCGDLDQLLYPASEHLDEEYISNQDIDYDSFFFENVTDGQSTKDSLENYMSDREDHDNDFTAVKKVMSKKRTSLYMIRDSFARAILPYMIASYDRARFVRSSAPSFENIESGADVIYEICERNLKNITGSTPIMYAPVRKDFKTSVIKSKKTTCICEDDGYAYKIYGKVDAKMVGKDGRVYIRLKDKTSSILMEAFPNFEDGYGYSAYLDKNQLGDGKYDVSIVSGKKESEPLICIPDDCKTVEDSEETNLKTENPYDAENTNHKIVFRDATFGIGDNINALMSQLGNQSAPPEAVYGCLAGGDAMVYHYPNLTIEADMTGSIYYISITEDAEAQSGEKAATEKGITVGSDKADIWDKLDKPTRENAKHCIYQMEHVKVTYSYKADKITSIILEESDASKLGEEVVEEEETPESKIAGIEYENGNTYLYSEDHQLKTGWQILDDEYYFFNRLTGERVVGETVDGIEIGEDGEVTLTDYDKQKIETMMKAHKIMEKQTKPTDSMEEKRKKVFDWVLTFPYQRHRLLKDYYTQEGIEIIMANDIFDSESGDCVSEAAALAFLFHEIGYTDVYWVHDTGHSWVRCEDRLYDPLFAEARDYDANYNAPFPDMDFRTSMAHNLLIY